MITMPSVLPRATESFESWYDSQSEDRQLLIDEINDRIYEGFDEDDYENFIAELESSVGIITADNLSDALWYQTDSVNPEAEFVEHLVSEVDCQELPPYLVIDWQASWDRNYRHDFSTMTFGEYTYFFHNNF